MRRPSTLLRVLKEIGPVIAAVVAGMLLLGLVGPAAAQFFPFFGGSGQPQRQAPRGGNGFFGGGDSPFFSPFQQQQPRRQAPREDFSRAPQSDKRDNDPAERNVLVLGDSMADWLGYGLEDAYAEQADMGVIRKHKTISGLIRYQPKGDPADWTAAAKGILAQENPNAIVVMLGLHDRVSLREPTAGDKKKDARGKPDDKSDAEMNEDTDIADPSPIIAPERSTRAPVAGMIEFRDDRWVELYNKKIDEMIAVVKGKGVPVLWIGLPAVRGAKATSDMLFLNGLYRAAAERAGITYVDIWDGFVDESGRFMQQGPDFEGQIRRLRSYDGVYFTKAGARKMAHYTEREIARLLLASRDGPVTLPSESTGPEVEAKPDGPAPRPLAGPILPLVVSSVNSDQLLGGPGARPTSTDAMATRLMVRGESLEPPPGRADDAAWPRREVGRETAPRGGDMPVAAASPADGVNPAIAAPAAPKPRRPRPQVVQQPQQQPAFPSFFTFGGQQSQQPQRSRPAPGPRQPAGFGPSAGFSGFFR